MKILALLLPFSLLFAGSIDIEKASLRTTYENLSISPDEDMGLMGINYLLEPNDYFYYGLGLYGAMSGERGGFFVGGFTAGAKYPIVDNLYLDGGVYVGGGGGASAGQGGGLMLKTYGGVLYRFDDYSVGINYSKIKFPNGDIDADQIALVADMRFDTIFVDTPLNAETLKQYHFTSSQDYIVATYQVYFPKSGTLTRNGAELNKNINLAGIEYGKNISEHTIAYIESAGATGGATGYMEVLGGLGYKQDITESTNLIAKLSLGGAGGGEVDTGGGTVTKASLNLNYSPTKKITTGIGAGYYHAFDGNFDAAFAKVNLGINANFLSLGSAEKSVDWSAIESQKIHIRLANQSYLYSDTLSTNPNNKDAVQNLGIKLDWFATENFYISGQALGAYEGGAGGYAVGMFGVGYIQTLAYDFSLVGEISIGAAGGGSINSGDGSIVQPMAGLMYDINDKVSLEVMYGRVIALDGKLDTDVIDFSIVYKFNKLIMK
ncbi:MAG: hypothetical protein PHU40_03730 [Sulfurimonas sp.]|nr:hypothetical protein [Sulfurimonas sp.]